MGEPSTRESVKVAVRLRPLSKNELKSKYRQIVEIDQKAASVHITNPQGTKVQFTYDFAFPENCTQEEIYENTSANIVDGCLQGFNGTIFAYGQTGTGKTYTMDGTILGDNRGIVPRAFEHIFDFMAANAESHKFSITMQYVEIYNEQIRDLLSTKPTQGTLIIREDPNKGFYIQHVEIRTVETMEDLFKFQAEGKQRRVTRSTNMNDESSRSHSIMTLNIETLTEIEGGSHVRCARLNLVDLAGSERAAKTGAEGQGFDEGISINYALMVLGNCISALTSRGHTHIPYRDSALTKLLRDSLGGNARTLMIAALGPADYNFQETMSTLRYAENAKKIKNKPKVNMDPKDALLMQYQEEVMRLQAQLKAGTPEGQAEFYAKTIRDMESRVEKQRKELEAASRMGAEERAMLQQKLEERRKELEEERTRQSKFAGRLDELKRFLVKGSGHLKERTEKNEAEIAAIREKLKKRAEHAAAIEREIEEKKAKKQQMIEQCSTIQGKVAMISEKFKETVADYKNLKAKIPEVQKAIQADREVLAGQIDSLNRQLELYTLILENFVPQADVQRWREAAEFDEDEEVWKTREPDKRAILKKMLTLERPNSACGCPRPTAADMRKGGPVLIDEIPVIEMKPAPVESRLKDGPKIIDMAGIEEEIEEQFKDDEADFVVEIPQELPEIAPQNRKNVSIFKGQA
jgi:kinesin family protein 3/17